MLNVKTVKPESLLQKNRCPECGGNKFVTDAETGEMICNSCGLVLQDRTISQKPEWRAFTPEERETKTRVGMPTSLTQFDKGLSTSFQPYTDVSGKTLPFDTRQKMIRLRKWNTRAVFHSSLNRNLSQAMTELKTLADKTHIPEDVVEEAALIYRRALREGLVRGRSISSLIAASLYMACRMTRTPRNLKTIVEASSRGKKEVARCYRLIHRELGLKIPVDDPMKYISKIASKLGISQKTQNRAVKLLQQAEKMKASTGKGPVGLAAAALYTASIIEGEKITQKDLANVAGVTEVTVRNRYKRLAKDLGLKDIASL